MLIRSILEPEVQLLPKIVYGPTKKKIVAPRKKTKKTNIPIENRANRHVPLFYLFLLDFSEPARPATPRSRKTIEEM